MAYRTYDGTGNNLDHPSWGAAGTNLARQSASAYSDGLSALAVRGPLNPNPRDISNKMCAQHAIEPNGKCLTDMFWAWGQFLDHEIDLTPEGTEEEANITTPANDPVLADATIPFHRSIYDPLTGTTDPRQQPNILSAYVDATNVYGADKARADTLRLLDGSGKLKTSLAANGQVLLPLNTEGLPNASPPGSNPADFFLAGDVRANENILLTSLHTLFVREHNRLCDQLAEEHPEWVGNDEVLYQEARKIVGALEQVITYREFLTPLLGCCPKKHLYSGYKTDVDAAIKTEFSTAAYRLGHSMLNSIIRVGAADGVLLRDAFFRPQYVQENGIEALLDGATHELMQKVDNHIVEDVRSFLFGPPNPITKMMLDLASLNLQRSRDHGIPDYNTVRQAYGLCKITSFSEISHSAEVQDGLRELYGDVDSIDLWIGGLCEDHYRDAMVGETFYAILSDQFLRLRDGDRYYYKYDTHLSKKWKRKISKTRLSDIIRRNTDLKHVPCDVFHK